MKRSLRWFKVLVEARVHDGLGFMQSFWVATTDAADAQVQVARHLTKAGAELVCVEECSSIDDPEPMRADFKSHGRAFFPPEDDSAEVDEP